MDDEIRPSKKCVKKNIAALRSLVEKEENSMTKRKFKHKPLIIAITVVAGLLLITGAASIIHQNGFRFDKGHNPAMDYFIMITENADDAPSTIEKICYDYNLPSRYNEDDSYIIENQEAVKRCYDSEAGSGSGGLLIIIQSTKSFFTNPVIVGEDVWEPTKIKGCKGFTIVHTDDRGEYGKVITNTVIWDCGDYIHTVVGHNISMEEIMSIVDGMTKKQVSPNN